MQPIRADSRLSISALISATAFSRKIMATVYATVHWREMHRWTSEYYASYKIGTLGAGWHSRQIGKSTPQFWPS